MLRVKFNSNLPVNVSPLFAECCFCCDNPEHYPFVHLALSVIMLPKQLQHSTCPLLITQPTDGRIAGTKVRNVGSCQYNQSKRRDIPEDSKAFLFPQPMHYIFI